MKLTLNLTALGLSALTLISPLYAQSENPVMTNPQANSGSSIVFIGTYTGKGSEGIYKFLLDTKTGKLKHDGLAAKISNPSFLALSSDKKYLYCCNEISDFNGKKSGAATSFEITSATGLLRELDQAPSGGVGPCYVSTTPNNDAVLIANYGSGSAAIIPTMPDGELEQNPSAVAQLTGSSINPTRQKEPHTHSIRPDLSGKWAVAVDLGIDQLIAFRLSKGTMDTSSPVVNKTTPGLGPRHIAFHPNGKLAYVSNELDSSVTAYRWFADTGELWLIQTIPANSSGDENYPAEILVHPNGKILYVTNRGQNTVATFSIDVNSGGLTPISEVPTQGDHPRGMALSPDGTWLLVANQNTNNILSFKIDPADGIPVFASEFKGLDRPVAFQFYTP